MKKLNQPGFSAIALLSGLMLLVAVGFVGYYVYNNQIKKADDVATTTETQKADGTEKSTPDIKQNTTTNSAKAGWKTFTNPSVGYQVDYPAVLVTSKCIKSNVLNDNYGNVVTANPEHYSITLTTGASTIVESADGKSIYITTDKTAKLYNESKSTNLPDRDIYLACDDISATTTALDIQTAGKSTSSSGSYSFSYLKPTIQKASPSEIATILGKKYEISNLSVKLEPVAGSNGQIVMPSTGLANGRVDVRYYAKNNLLVIWPLGQSCQLYTTVDSENCIDSTVVDSFRVL